VGLVRGALVTGEAWFALAGRFVFVTIRGVARGTAGGAVGAGVDVTLAGVGEAVGIVFAGPTSGVWAAFTAGAPLNDIEPVRHISGKFSFVMAISMAFRPGRDGSNGRAIGLPFINSLASATRNFEKLSSNLSLGWKSALPPASIKRVLLASSTVTDREIGSLTASNSIVIFPISGIASFEGVGVDTGSGEILAIGVGAFVSRVGTSEGRLR
jgi:hypothetical protein